MLCYGTNTEILALKLQDFFLDHTTRPLHFLRVLFYIILIPGVRVMEVLPSGASPIVAVGEEISRIS